MTEANSDEALNAYRVRLDDLSGDDERELLTEVIRAGWEAGCWIRVDDALLVRARDAEVDDFLAQMRARRSERVGEPEPYPDGLPHEPSQGTDACWIVIAQKCDIVAGLADEPFVELARAYDLDDRGLAGSLWKNSNRVFPLDPRDKRWVVDLRHRASLPKDALRDLGPARQAVPTDADQPPFKPRSRFLRRIGQRYGRAAVPSDYEALIEELLALSEVPRDSHVPGLALAAATAR